ncbi:MULTISPECIES: peptide-methionine (S)-S-oxide reductase MsrA [unclassified Campylobacter]|uniref:peptide-methionine (S)-S-oxide reductase MsrA n=1 Tax=unclassified Campylobacter TaxID=2593542 RepID=UPI0012382A4B|nr:MULTISPECIES: peptide-methionine (S)-S-oxide reductase MsrA [unclassified Campylobacter]KAA6224759.1 peptide-methionine (S)-S-oxide reductase MsrA [Campylobacter sp. LR185c]KAA6225756.1 peptide-methionine (S)-S-oxide reductase MsrA [Campylobacter sp. LR286c]KAA6225877.1 peptide-methionine (S)-S-oxide reductase MsrA [Campylobacter sp. LR196d]KAA6229729.1 peptide-methionine (S)-S-oxide reductase MsrA [Campylobacter sp. LR291e]KAA6230145.1 peptide-methionine (S)-S-oxide reductase MsrA [Campylo
MLGISNASEKSIILGGGCFWCVEAVFETIEGVTNTEVGYSGGPMNPTYKSVSNGDGNIEVAKISFDDSKISLNKVLELFFKMHDPTSLDRQGADAGIQYRSAIFYESNDDKKIIDDFIKNAQNSYSKPIVTKLYKLESYTKAEDYHQHYFKKNPNAAYCRFVIAPKLDKVKNH